jgi:GTP-binding protein
VQVTFVGSYPDLAQRPQPVLPEFAMLGRSNCGKSSLINYLLQRKGLARTSRQPGKTRLLNYFLVGERYYLVDLPGYGYAKFSQQERQRWWRLFEQYLTTSDRPLAVLHLIDSRHEPSEQDREVSGWLVESGRPFAVVATKIDKVGASRRLAHYRRIIEGLELAPEVAFLPTSARLPAGRPELLSWVKETLGGGDHVV